MVCVSFQSNTIPASFVDVCLIANAVQHQQTGISCGSHTQRQSCHNTLPATKLHNVVAVPTTFAGHSLTIQNAKIAATHLFFGRA